MSHHVFNGRFVANKARGQKYGRENPVHNWSLPFQEVCVPENDGWQAKKNYGYGGDPLELVEAFLNGPQRSIHDDGSGDKKFCGAVDAADGMFDASNADAALVQ